MKSLGRLGTVVAVIVLVPFMVYRASRWATDLPHADAILSELKDELSKIQPPHTVRTEGTHESRKPEQVLLSANYRGQISYSDLRTYYDSQLSRNGWTFTHEESLKNWGRDLGEKQACYSKGNYAAFLYYRGEVGDEYTYSLGLSWGMH